MNIETFVYSENNARRGPSRLAGWLESPLRPGGAAKLYVVPVVNAYRNAPETATRAKPSAEEQGADCTVAADDAALAV